MSTLPQTGSPTSAGPCPKCNEALVPGKAYCPNCGLLVGSPADAALRAYVDAKLSTEMNARIKDSSGVVREVADKVEDIVWGRMKRYTVISGIFLAVIAALLTFIGLKTYDDIKQSVLKRVEPAVSQIEQRTRDANATIDDLNKNRIPAVTRTLNAVDAEAKSQRNRVESFDGEIKKGLVGLSTAESRAAQDSEHFQQNVAANQAKLDQMTQRSQAQITQIATSASRASVDEAYPALSQSPQVEIRGQVLNVKNKKPGEKWVSLVLSSGAVRDSTYRKEQVEQVEAALLSAGFRVFVGTVTASGRYGIGLDHLGNEVYAEESEIFYFSERSRPIADEALGIVSKRVFTMGAKPVLASSKSFPDLFKAGYQFIIEQSGLDAQVFLGSQPSH